MHRRERPCRPGSQSSPLSPSQHYTISDIRQAQIGGGSASSVGRQFETRQIAGSAPVLEELGKGSRPGSVWAVGSRPRGGLALVVLVARRAFLLKAHSPDRQRNDCLDPFLLGFLRSFGGLYSVRETISNDVGNVFRLQGDRVREIGCERDLRMGDEIAVRKKPTMHAVEGEN